MEVPALLILVSILYVDYETEWDLPSGRVKALDEFLDLPHLNILLRCILTHLKKNLGDTGRLVDVDENACCGIC